MCYLRGQVLTLLVMLVLLWGSNHFCCHPHFQNNFCSKLEGMVGTSCKNGNKPFFIYKLSPYLDIFHSQAFEADWVFLCMASVACFLSSLLTTVEYTFDQLFCGKRKSSIQLIFFQLKGLHNIHIKDYILMLLILQKNSVKSKMKYISSVLSQTIPKSF